MRDPLLRSSPPSGGACRCKPDYSANTYNSAAVQQANKVDQAVVIGRRSVGVTPTGATGGTTGAAAGGVAGAQIGTGVTAAFGGIGGTLVGGMVGSAVEKSQGETTAYEYVVRKTSIVVLSASLATVPLNVTAPSCARTFTPIALMPDCASRAPVTAVTVTLVGGKLGST